MSAWASGAEFREGAPVPMTLVRDQCAEFTDIKNGGAAGDYRECGVSEFGAIGKAGDQTFYYAIYCLLPNWAGSGEKCGDGSFAARYHGARALALFFRDAGGGNARLFLARSSAEMGIFFYEKPEIVRHAADMFLYLPIIVDGTGHGNASEYYLRRGERWDRIESEAWTAELRRQLPDGLQIWKGIWPDLRSMTAKAGLYRQDDANCCPTGGIARLRLAVRDMQFIIDSLTIETTPKGEK